MFWEQKRTVDMRQQLIDALKEYEPDLKTGRSDFDLCVSNKHASDTPVLNKYASNRYVPDEYTPEKSALNERISWTQNTEPAAVLVPILSRGGQCYILLTRRSESLSRHGGQISFPGGRVDRSDENRTATALRETFEEVGIDPEFITVIGQLDTYYTMTGFAITPVVGVVETGYRMEIEPNEVAEVFEIPVSFILDRSNYKLEKRIESGETRIFYAISFGSYYIWGATAAMLVNLADIILEKDCVRQGTG